MRKRIIFEQPELVEGQHPVIVPFSVVPGTVLVIVDSAGNVVERLKVRSIEMKKQKGGKRIKPASITTETMPTKKYQRKGAIA